jgi:CheY-like chemotaxis protein
MTHASVRAMQAGCVALACMGLPLGAQPEDKLNAPPNVIDGPELVQALRGGGHVLYFRHGITDLSTRDSDRASHARPRARPRAGAHAQAGADPARINLPDMDGYAVMQILREHEATRQIPVLAISANAMPKDIERGKAAGFAAYLTKPIDVLELLRTVTQLLAAPRGGDTAA